MNTIDSMIADVMCQEQQHQVHTFEHMLAGQKAKTQQIKTICQLKKSTEGRAKCRQGKAGDENFMDEAELWLYWLDFTFVHIHTYTQVN